VNLESEVDTDLRDRYLLANLLTYYEQIYVFNQDPETVRNTYNIKFPLLVFIGHTVNATTKSQVSKNEDRTLTDVEKSLNFMARVLRNEDNWVPKAIDRVLQKDAGLVDDDEIDPFGETRLKHSARPISTAKRYTTSCWRRCSTFVRHLV